MGISIAMATYNGATYLREQLDSILNQTINFNELVISDDRSTDGTWDILREYSERDHRIKIYQNTENLGFKKNFEKTILLCRNELIALSDQDDIWLPFHLEELNTNINGYDLICGDAEVFYEKIEFGKRESLFKIKNFDLKKDNKKDIFRFVTYYQNPFQGASMMGRRSFFLRVLPIPDNVAFHDVWFSMNASIVNSIEIIKVPITLYRMHGDNTSGIHKKGIIWRSIAGHLLKKELSNNRKEIIVELNRRIFNNQSAQLLLAEAMSYYKDRTVITRIKNTIFELTHYNLIFG